MQTRILESEYLGRRIENVRTGKQYTVEQIYAEGMSRHFIWEKENQEPEPLEDLDWFIKLLIADDNQSHGVLFWEAISVKSKSLNRQIEETRQTFRFLT